ncbi:hypothetical protein CEC48_29840 [Pseudomonas sp. K2I15]|nr:hypothetical protein CEC48_29840 [Pseudomonas sp. K2I15]
MLLWRGSLLPLGREAAPVKLAQLSSKNAVSGFRAAAQPSGSKLPHHSKRPPPQKAVLSV